MSRVHIGRRAALLSGGALLAAAPVVAAPVVGQDAELIALLDEGRAALRAWQYAPADTAPTLASILAPKPWEGMLHAAAMLPARTPEGIRAKAETVADWLAGSDRRTGPGFDCTRETAVAWSLMRDLLGADEIAPVPPLRRHWTEEDEAKVSISMTAAAQPDAALLDLCAEHVRLADEGHRLLLEMRSFDIAVRAVLTDLERMAGGVA